MDCQRLRLSAKLPPLLFITVHVVLLSWQAALALEPAVARLPPLHQRRALRGKSLLRCCVRARVCARVCVLCVFAVRMA